MTSDKKRVTVSLSERVIEILDELVKDKGINRSAIITLALEEFQKGQEK